MTDSNNRFVEWRSNIAPGVRMAAAVIFVIVFANSAPGLYTAMIQGEYANALLYGLSSTVSFFVMALLLAPLPPEGDEQTGEREGVRR